MTTNLPEILTHAQLALLLERNVMNPELGRPVYQKWTDNKGKCNSYKLLAEANKRANAQCFRVESHQSWMKRLSSKRWRIQDCGKSATRQVERPVKVAGSWVMRPLNSLAQTL